MTTPVVTVGQCPECGSPMIEERRVINATLGRRSDCKVSFMGVVRACVVCDEIDTGFNLEFGQGSKRPLKGFEVDAAQVAQDRAEQAAKDAAKEAKDAKKKAKNTKKKAAKKRPKK